MYFGLCLSHNNLHRFYFNDCIEQWYPYATDLSTIHTTAIHIRCTRSPLIWTQHESGPYFARESRRESREIYLYSRTCTGRVVAVVVAVATAYPLGNALWRGAAHISRHGRLGARNKSRAREQRFICIQTQMPRTAAIMCGARLRLNKRSPRTVSATLFRVIATFPGHDACATSVLFLLSKPVYTLETRTPRNNEQKGRIKAERPIETITRIPLRVTCRAFPRLSPVPKLHRVYYFDYYARASTLGSSEIYEKNITVKYGREKSVRHKYQNLIHK